MHAEIANRVPADVAARDLPELVAVPGRANHVLEVHVHVGVAIEKDPVVGLAVLELDKDSLSLCTG